MAGGAELNIRFTSNYISVFPNQYHQEMQRVFHLYSSRVWWWHKEQLWGRKYTQCTHCVIWCSIQVVYWYTLYYTGCILGRYKYSQIYNYTRLPEGTLEGKGLLQPYLPCLILLQIHNRTVCPTILLVYCKFYHYNRWHIENSYFYLPVRGIFQSTLSSE